MRLRYVVVIEREDDDPRVVVFDDLDDALWFRRRFNKISEEKWPSGFHNYARDPIGPLSIDAALKLLDEEGER